MFSRKNNKGNNNSSEDKGHAAHEQYKQATYKQ